MAAMADDTHYRKPHPGMWSLYQDLYPLVPASLEFYCGDAAGRPNDHADTDRRWALNLNIDFFLPEQLFFEEALQQPDLSFLKKKVDCLAEREDSSTGSLTP